MLVFAFVALAASAQKGAVVTVPSITVTDAGTSTAVFQLSGTYQSLTVQVVCTNVSGTTGGTLTLLGSVDGTSYVTITDVAGFVKGYSTDALTMTNGAIWNKVILHPVWKYYKVSAAGTGTQVSTVAIKYILK